MITGAEHPLLLQPLELVGSYRLVRRIATGGYGAVFLAEMSGHPVALKFALQGPLDPDDVARVDARTQKEMSVLSRLAHPNVVALRGHNRWPHPSTGYLFLVLDYVEGPTLSEWAVRQPITPRQVARVFCELALTLDAIHREGVRHRDIKGSNIIIRASDGRPVLVDFGSGDHACAPVLTEGRLPPGTPSYRSPESLQYLLDHPERGSRYHFKPTDDLYSLGLVLHEVLTGTFPYPTQLPPAALLGSIIARRQREPHGINPRVPRALSTVCQRLLAPNAEDRYQTGSELYGALSAALEHARPSWDAPLFVAPTPQEAITEEEEELFDGDEEARELRRWMRAAERPGGASDSGTSRPTPSAPTLPEKPAEAPAPAPAPTMGLVAPLPPPPPWYRARLAALRRWLGGLARRLRPGRRG